MAELIELAAEPEVISGETSHSIREYLAFRHFFTHAYAFDLDPQRLEPLVANLGCVSDAFKRDVAKVTQPDS